MEADNVIPVRRIPVLTQAEVESIRTPEDITRIVQAQPEREYQMVCSQEADGATICPSMARKRRHSAFLQAVCLGAAGYAFGISNANCVIHLTFLSGILATMCATALWAAGSWVYRSRR